MQLDLGLDVVWMGLRIGAEVGGLGQDLRKEWDYGGVWSWLGLGEGFG